MRKRVCVLRSALLLLCLSLEMIGDWRLEMEMEKLHRSECILSILQGEGSRVKCGFER